VPGAAEGVTTSERQGHMDVILSCKWHWQPGRDPTGGNKYRTVISSHVTDISRLDNAMQGLPQCHIVSSIGVLLSKR
jgi:hypothetical protein